MDQGVLLNEKLCKEKISEREVRYNVNKNNVCLITLSIPSRIILGFAIPVLIDAALSFNSIKDYQLTKPITIQELIQFFQFHQGLSRPILFITGTFPTLLSIPSRIIIEVTGQF